MQLRMVVKTTAELMLKHGGRCLLRPVRADQLDAAFRWRVNRGAAATV